MTSASADWPTAAAWLARGSDDPDALVVAGVPLVDHAVTAGSRYDLAPAAIRQRLAKLSTWQSQRRVDLDHVDVRDLGDDLRPSPLAAPSPSCWAGTTGSRSTPSPAPSSTGSACSPSTPTTTSARTRRARSATGRRCGR